jgi:hypothetical protein
LQRRGTGLSNQQGRAWNFYLHVVHTQAVFGVSAVKSQVEAYRAKAKEYARLTILTKSLRESRRYRKLADMYWALALGEKSESAQPSKMTVKTSPT